MIAEEELQIINDDTRCSERAFSPLLFYKRLSKYNTTVILMLAGYEFVNWILINFCFEIVVDGFGGV